ncbi:hypothetical protein [Vibrio europaeus]|uniref:hypothetical protein n=1 Tax=Vibrio europaeus TaxID=300876 RepID=UPI0039E0E1AC
MTMSWILFNHGFIAAVLLVIYALIVHFMLTDPRGRWKEAASYQSGFKWTVHGSPLIALMMFLVLAYGLVDYGLYYFSAYHDVFGLVRYLTYERFSQGDEGIVVSIVGGGCGAFLAITTFVIGKRYYLNQLDRIERENRWHQDTLKYQRQLLESWFTEVFHTLVNRDRRKISKTDGVQVTMDLIKGTFEVDKPILLSGPEQVIQSLDKLNRSLQSGSITMQTSERYGPVTIKVELEFEETDWQERMEVNETRTFKMTRR